MLPAALATASGCQPRARCRRRRAAAHRPPARPGLTRRPAVVQPGNVVPTRSHGADYRSRSISWVFALSKMSLASEALLDYNRQDCEALELAADKLVELHRTAQSEGKSSRSDLVLASELK